MVRTCAFPNCFTNTTKKYEGIRLWQVPAWKSDYYDYSGWTKKLVDIIKSYREEDKVKGASKLEDRAAKGNLYICYKHFAPGDIEIEGWFVWLSLFFNKLHLPWPGYLLITFIFLWQYTSWNLARWYIGFEGSVDFFERQEKAIDKNWTKNPLVCYLQMTLKSVMLNEKFFRIIYHLLFLILANGKEMVKLGALPSVELPEKSHESPIFPTTRMLQSWDQDLQDQQTPPDPQWTCWRSDFPVSSFHQMKGIQIGGCPSGLLSDW